MSRIVCSTTHLYHYLFNDTESIMRSIEERGLRPLSDFPDSERWQQLEEMQPGFYEMLYERFAKPIINRPYINSGIFLTPIDFYQLPTSFLATKPRYAIPVELIEPTSSVITYELDGDRHIISLTDENLGAVAKLWLEDLVQEWFGKDPTKAFFYVPQVATYPAAGIPVSHSYLQYPPN